MIATSTTVLIYSTQNSLLVHTLRHGEHTEISSYFLSPSDPTRLYTTSRSGSIVAWNWPIEQQTAIWETGAPCLGAAVALSADGTDVLFTIDGLRKSAITARELGSDANEISSKIILNHDARITSVQVTADAMYVVGMTQLGLVVGRSSNPARKAYKWLDFRTGEPPACMALQAVQKLVESTESRVPKQKDVIINVAVGGVKGCIYTYENLAESLSLSGKSSKSIADGVVPSVREMHWHREAVGTVAWSLDGENDSSVDAVKVTNQHDRQLFNLWWAGNSSGSLAVRDCEKAVPAQPRITYSESHRFTIWFFIRCRSG